LFGRERARTLAGQARYELGRFHRILARGFNQR
jgi:hypothetical protein